MTACKYQRDPLFVRPHIWLPSDETSVNRFMHYGLVETSSDKKNEIEKTEERGVLWCRLPGHVGKKKKDLLQHYVYGLCVFFNML